MAVVSAPTMDWTQRLTTLTPWQRRMALVGCGLFGALALPPLHLVPLLWLAVPGLLLLMGEAPSPRRAFLTGWWFGLGYFAAGLYWVSHAMMVDPLRHGWMIPFAVLLLGGGMGLFIGLTTLLAGRLAPRVGLARVFALTGAWTLVEWLRAWVLTGFPWNLLGTVWMPLEAMLQPAAWIGTYGLSLVTLVAAGLPSLFAVTTPRRAAAGLLGGLALLGLLGGAGALRLASADRGVVAGVRLRLVQPAIPQSLKWADGLRQEHLDQQIALSRSPGFEHVTHVIWAETSVPYYVDLNDDARAAVATAAPPGGVVIVGAPRRTPLGVAPVRVWNSLFAIDDQARIVGAYDKVHLVPFGEYMPLRSLLPFEKFTVGGLDFSAGPGRATLALPGVPPASPLICYEIIFPGEVLGPGERPGWIVNITNDGWFGISSGPYQHFATSRLRAIEEGLPVARIANTGISAIIDAHGGVRASLGLGSDGVIDGGLPLALPATVYARFGAAVPLALASLLWFLSVVMGRYSCKERHDGISE